jgi:hypothetical protein
MRIIALGDTHGRTYWNYIADNETFDQLVFIGDYFDSVEGITPEEQVQNFKDILAYKKQNMDNVILLIGNHDYHYLESITNIYSGHQAEYATIINALLENAIMQGLMQMCFLSNNYLFTHAGITKTWANENHISFDSIEFEINNLFKANPNKFQFKKEENCNQTGNDSYQSPIWVRPNSLIKDGIKGFIQIVGHTPKAEIVLNNDFIFIDTLGENQQYLKIINGKCNVYCIPIFYIKHKD